MLVSWLSIEESDIQAACRNMFLTRKKKKKKIKRESKSRGRSNKKEIK